MASSEWEDLCDVAREVLTKNDFVCDDSEAIGPMGSRNVYFASAYFQIALHNDRGSSLVTAGPVSGPTFVWSVWATLFDEVVTNAKSPIEQLNFFLSHLVRMKRVVSDEFEVATKLRSINMKELDLEWGIDSTD